LAVTTGRGVNVAGGRVSVGCSGAGTGATGATAAIVGDGTLVACCGVGVGAGLEQALRSTTKKDPRPRTQDLRSFNFMRVCAALPLRIAELKRAGS
jgi:hypothetical protein